MNYEEFVQAFHRLLPPNTVLNNPGGGTTTIVDFNDEKIKYKRRNSDFRVKYADLFDAFDHFRGKRVSTNDLKAFRPKVFSSKNSGHDCNCTFLFQFLQTAGKVDGIHGDGKRNRPFWVVIQRE
jgi:hypothetical protein